MTLENVDPPDCARNHESTAMIAVESGQEESDSGDPSVMGALGFSTDDSGDMRQYKVFQCPVCNRRLRMQETDSGIDMQEIESGDL